MGCERGAANGQLSGWAIVEQQANGRTAGRGFLFQPGQPGQAPRQPSHGTSPALVRKRLHTSGRVGRPNSWQRLSAVNCTQRTPAGLPSGIPGMGDEIERAIQQAPQPTRQSIASRTFQDITVVKKLYGCFVRAVFPKQRKEPDAALANRETRWCPQRHDLRDESAFAIRNLNFGIRFI